MFTMLSLPLPLRYAVPFQLGLVAAWIMSFKTFVCAAAQYPPFLQAAPTTCRMVQMVAYGTTGFPPAATSSVLTTMYPEVCQGVLAICLLQLYIDIVIILVLPTVCTYALEFQAKKSFLATKNMQLQHAWGTGPGVNSWYMRLIIGMVSLSVLWVLLEAVVRQLAPSC
jgi:hypothetical protein